MDYKRSLSDQCDAVQPSVSNAPCETSPPAPGRGSPTMQWHHRSTPGPEERERRKGEVKDRMEAEGGKGNREERRKGGGKERSEPEGGRKGEK